MLIKEEISQKALKPYLSNRTITKIPSKDSKNLVKTICRDDDEERRFVRYVKNEQRELYQQHLQRMATVKSKVNTHLPPPKIKIEGNRMELSYMEMLTALYRRSNEENARTFTKAPEHLAAGRWRNANIARQLARQQEENNKHRIMGTGNTHFAAYMNTPRRKRASRKVKAFSYEIPLHVLHRYENLIPKCDVGILCKLLRPQIYFELQVKGIRTRERIVVQLFTEACPQIVLQFMRICSLQETARIIFARNFSPLWLEGKLLLDPRQPISMDNIEHDFDVINHGVDAGILSFPCRYVRGSKNSILNFTISFKPLSILNGKRIGFGKIRRGLGILEKIQRMMPSTDKRENSIVLIDCGIL